MARRRDANGIDEIDAHIIELIQLDARMPNTAIAKTIGLSEAAVRKRLDRLVKKQIISLKAHVDPLKVGFNIWSLIQIQTTAVRAIPVARAIAELPSAMMVALATGNFDVYVVGLFRTTEELNDFLDELRKMRGVQRTSTAFVTELIKRDFGFGVPVIEGAQASTRTPGKRGKQRNSDLL
jgi:Lrp/AsnC family transcriptional regulator for asnA, asnC and gidA